jgi:hypothetical protein
MIFITYIKYLIIIYILSCSNDQTSLNKDKLLKERSTLLAISYYRNIGECLRKETLTDSSIYTCSKYDNGLCSINLLIFTSGEKTKLLSETAKIIDRRPECTESLALSGLLTQSITTNDEIDALKRNNTFSGVDNCNTKSFSKYEKLISKEELLFLVSARGKIGTYAYKSAQFPIETSIKKNAQECLNNEFSESESQLFKDIYSGSKVQDVKCTENTSTGVCN